MSESWKGSESVINKSTPCLALLDFESISVSFFSRDIRDIGIVGWVGDVLRDGDVRERRRKCILDHPSIRWTSFRCRISSSSSSSSGLLCGSGGGMDIYFGIFCSSSPSRATQRTSGNDGGRCRTCWRSAVPFIPSLLRPSIHPFLPRFLTVLR